MFLKFYEKFHKSLPVPEIRFYVLVILFEVSFDQYVRHFLLGVLNEEMLVSERKQNARGFFARGKTGQVIDKS